MNIELDEKLAKNDHMGCFGSYAKNDPVCRKLCALNLRCAIEQDQSQRMEIIEDLVGGDGLFIKVQ